MVGEEQIIDAALEVTGEVGAKEIAKQAAASAVDEAIKWGPKEWFVAGTSAVGTVALVAGAIWGASKGVKAIANHIRKKKGVPVAEEVPDTVATVESESKDEKEIKVEK